MSTPSYRKMTPNEFIARVQGGYDLLQYKDTHTLEQWKQYAQKEGLSASSANERITLARCLLRDRVRDHDRLHEIAYLRLPYDVIVKACGQKVTDEQREQFFALFTPPQSDLDLLPQDEIFERLETIINPPPPKPELLSYHLFEDADDKTVPEDTQVQLQEIYLQLETLTCKLGHLLNKTPQKPITTEVLKIS